MSVTLAHRIAEAGDHCKFEANLVSKIKASLDYMVWLHPLLKLFIFVWDKIN